MKLRSILAVVAVLAVVCASSVIYYAYSRNIDIWRINPVTELSRPDVVVEEFDKSTLIEVRPVVAKEVSLADLDPVKFDAVRWGEGFVIIGGFRIDEGIEMRAYELDADFGVVGYDVIDTLEHSDHLTIDAEIDTAGAVHVLWSNFIGDVKYTRMASADSLSIWTPTEVVSERSTYGTLFLDDGRVMVICRKGGHGQGWSLFNKQDDGSWTENRVVHGIKKHPAHAYLSRPAVKNPGDDELVFGIRWAHDIAGWMEGAHQYHRATSYSVASGEQHSLEGERVEGELSGVLSHHGPRYFDKMGSYISDTFHMKGAGEDLNKISKIHIGVAYEDENLQVLASLGSDGESPTIGRNLLASTWNGTGWVRNQLGTKLNIDLGTHRVIPVRSNETGSLWMINHKDAGDNFYSESSGFSFVEHLAEGDSWTLRMPTVTEPGYTDQIVAMPADECRLDVFYVRGTDFNRLMRIKRGKTGKELVASVMDLCADVAVAAPDNQE